MGALLPTLPEMDIDWQMTLFPQATVPVFGRNAKERTLRKLQPYGKHKKDRNLTEELVLLEGGSHGLYIDNYDEKAHLYREKTLEVVIMTKKVEKEFLAFSPYAYKHGYHEQDLIHLGLVLDKLYIAYEAFFVASNYCLDKYVPDRKDIGRDAYRICEQLKSAIIAMEVDRKVAVKRVTEDAEWRKMMEDMGPNPTFETPKEKWKFQKEKEYQEGRQEVKMKSREQRKHHVSKTMKMATDMGRLAGYLGAHFDKKFILGYENLIEEEKLLALAEVEVSKYEVVLPTRKPPYPWMTKTTVIDKNGVEQEIYDLSIHKKTDDMEYEHGRVAEELNRLKRELEKVEKEMEEKAEDKDGYWKYRNKREEQKFGQKKIEKKGHQEFAWMEYAVKDDSLK